MKTNTPIDIALKACYFNASSIKEENLKHVHTLIDSTIEYIRKNIKENDSREVIESFTKCLNKAIKL